MRRQRGGSTTACVDALARRATTCRGSTSPFEPAFYVASASRMADALSASGSSIRSGSEMYRARTLFDLRPVGGPHSLWNGARHRAVDAVDRDFVQVLANDCLASLPPLTFFEDAVVDRSGEQSRRFASSRRRCGRSSTSDGCSGWRRGACYGHVDARAFRGRARRCCRSTRRSSAKRRYAAHRALAAGRVGISQGTAGSELPPALLSRHDRHVLKSGFRSILRLLEFTADSGWLDRAVSDPRSSIAIAAASSRRGPTTRRSSGVRFVVLDLGDDRPQSRAPIASSPSAPSRCSVARS